MIDLKKAPKRSKNNRVIFGVCAGIAKNFDIDPFWIRLVSILLIPGSIGFAVLIYVGLAIVMEEEK